jgi:Methylase involved in ubiquinone/menaquinone biosynthesis
MSDQSHLRYQKNLEELDANESHIQIVRLIPSNARVLDVGCACGDLGVYLARHKQCRLFGLEYNEASIAAARSTGAYEDIGQTDLNALEPMPPSFPGSFDRIVFGDVLEHLLQPEQVLRSFLPFLGKEGRVVISLPNIAHGSIVAQLLLNKFTYMNYGILDKTHIRFFTLHSIARMMATVGLQILASSRTIWNLAGLHRENPEKLLPRYIVGYLAANPHSYVLQYVFEASLSGQRAYALEKHNISRLYELTEEERERIAQFQGTAGTAGAK